MHAANTEHCNNRNLSILPVCCRGAQEASGTLTNATIIACDRMNRLDPLIIVQIIEAENRLRKYCIPPLTN